LATNRNETRWRSPGFTLIELITVLVVASVLMALAVPSFTTWIGNSKVRSVAESLQNAIRAAQTEALRRGRQTAFILTNAAPAANATPNASGANWYIQVLPLFASDTIANPCVEGGSLGSKVSGVTIKGGPPTLALCFNSMGRLVNNTTTIASTGATCAVPANPPVTYSVTSARADRTLNVQVQTGGQVRMCDASRTLSTTNPDGC
jgi:type IV fimbrial biogenesis protein FimT